MADLYELLPHHLDQLHQGSGLSLDIIQERGYRSLQGTEGYKILKDLGFSKLQCKLTPGLLLPVWSPDPAVLPALRVYRPDNPRPDERNGRPRKYEFPKGQGMRLDCPPRCRALLQDPTIGLWVTEGQKKADALADRGMCVIDVLGVWNFKGRNTFRGTTILADWDYVALKDRHVSLVFDSDVMLVPAVRQALNRLTEHLQRKGARVVAVYLPQENGHKVGVDDYLLTHTVQDLEGLIEQPRPQPQAAPPIIELLGEAPKLLHRPLMSIDGRAYAATWLWTKTTQTEKVGKDGEVVRLQEPKVTQEQRLFVMRDDGVLFGEVSDPKVQPLAELLITIHLPDRPRDDLLWRAYGVTAYRQGHRPEPKEVFGRIVQVYNHFLDFHRSVDAQPTMCRLSACQSLMTWFADAFTVLPYPWPNSPAPGSGKTKWGHCWTKTSYLGYLTSASGSFAALRDLADMGATILFDDAEGLADPKADPDKQALILAGNRKGVSIPVKEAGPDGRWHTRWLNAYCPRGFTALRLPFPALQSRSIVVPLVASADAERANRDPENPDDWPVDQRALRDDLWALALFLQSEAATIWTELSKETSTIGRDWERWRAIIAVARLLERHGVEGLEQDMRAVMIAYHDEKSELEGESRVILVIRGLMRVVQLKPLDVWTLADVSDISPERVNVTASQMVEAIKAIAADEEDPDELQEDHEGKKTAKPWYYSARSVGRLLSKLRLKEERDSSPKRERSRVTSAKDVFSLALAHHLVYLKDEMSEPDVSRTPQHTQDMSADPSCPTDDMSGRLERITPDDPPQSNDMHAAHTYLSGKTSETSGDVQTSDPDDPIEPKNADNGHIHRMCSGTDEGRGGSYEIPAPHEE